MVVNFYDCLGFRCFSYKNNIRLHIIREQPQGKEIHA